MIEIMVVVIVIAILAAIIMPQFIGTTEEAKVSAAKANVSELANAVQRFYFNMDRFPTTEEGLKVLLTAPTGEESKWRGPYVSAIPMDPWGHPFQYRAPGVHQTATYDIWSRGADNADGGEGKDADIGNWGGHHQR